MSSAVHNLQKAIVEGKQSLTQLLRQTKLIAANLNLEDVEQWVDYELKGYPQDIEPPEYRHIHVTHMEIHNPFRGWEFAGHLNLRLTAREAISEIENLSQGEMLATTLPRQLPARDMSGSSFGSDFPQRAIIAASQFKKVVEAVTDELLQWSSKLDKRGIKGENMDFNEEEKQLATNVHIEKFTGVFGNVNNSQVAVNDYSSLAKLLIDQNVPTKERRELEDILEELKMAPPEKKKGLIAKAEDWMVKHGATLGTGAELVGKFISGLKGQHP